METLRNILPYLEVVFAILTVTGVLLQQSEAGLGGAFGMDAAGTGFHTKRGAEKVLFIATIVIAVLFVANSVTILLVR
ncbi:MAG: preprotein translocase subunit SecG [Patescibacteria group bacterium]